MRRKRKDEYHLLVAQNFLGNISLTGRHDDTKLRMFNSSDLNEESPSSAECFQKPDLIPLEISATVPEFKPKRSLASPIEQDEDPFSQSYPSFPKRHKKPPSSFFRRFVKILSSDQIIQSRERRLDREHVPLTSRSNKDDKRSRRESIGSGDRPTSPASESFLFFRKIRTSIARGERSYLCSSSTFAPFAVLSYFPFLSHDRHRLNRSHSTLAISTDRIRHISQCSVEELKPYEFHEDAVEISFGFLFARRRGVSPCGAIVSTRRSERRDSNYVESMTKLTDPEASDTLGTMISLMTKDPSFEPDEIEWDEPSGEVYSPSLFEEIEHSRRTVIRNTGYVGVTLQYSSKDTVKTTMNLAFAEKFPRVNLTYSKFKSIVAEMIRLCRQCNIDLSATAQSIIYFERIVHKALISKSNRKVVGGASILVSLKLNDYSKEHIKEFIETATDKLRISRRELLALEIPLCAALHFKLQASAEHVALHYDRLLIAS